LFLLTSFHFLLLFLLFVTFVNYFLLLKGTRGVVLFCFFIVQGESMRLDFILFLIYCWKGRGVDINVFFLFHLTCGRKRGGGLVFSLNFFSLLNGQGRGFRFFFFWFVEGGCEGEKVDCFLQIHYGGVGVGWTNLILAKIN